MTSFRTSLFVGVNMVISAFAFRGNSQSTRLGSLLFSTSTVSIQDAAIVGGGLAGLGLAFHLLEKSRGEVSITIYDNCRVGEGGASAVAGGLVHPLSPRGKLVHWGLEGLASTNRLVEAASLHVPECLLRNKIYRVALSEKNVEDLKMAATKLPAYCTWLDKDKMDSLLGSNSLGGLELSNGCRVIHVPSYLRGLYASCKEIGSIEWIVADTPTLRDDHDAVIWAGGAGMLQDKLLNTGLPVTLVRGASAELKVDSSMHISREAVLCGKYISPLPRSDRMLVGATHEFREKALTDEEVCNELRSKSYNLSPFVWDNSCLEQITAGYRVQSQRGALGRIPIVGRLAHCYKDWIFTGLSSRGLLYHGIYAEKLADMILHGHHEHDHLHWWKKV